MNRLRSPHTGAPCVRRRTCGAAQKRRGGYAAPKRWWGQPFPTRSVGSLVLARGGNHVPRRGISRPRPWRKPRASCAELLFPAWDHAPHPRGTPAVQWFWKDNPPGRLAASSPLYTRGPCMAHPGSFPETKNPPLWGGPEWSGLRGSNSLPVPGAARGPSRGPWTSMDPIEVEAASSGCRQLSGNKKPTPVGWA